MMPPCFISGRSGISVMICSARPMGVKLLTVSVEGGGSISSDVNVMVVDAEAGLLIVRIKF